MGGVSSRAQALGFDRVQDQVAQLLELGLADEGADPAAFAFSIICLFTMEEKTTIEWSRAPSP
jgi:hypothetical protein